MATKKHAESEPTKVEDPTACRCPKCGGSVSARLSAELDIDLSIGDDSACTVKPSIHCQPKPTLSCSNCGELTECLIGNERIPASEFTLREYSFEVTSAQRFDHEDPSDDRCPKCRGSMHVSRLSGSLNIEVSIVDLHADSSMGIPMHIEGAGPKEETPSRFTMILPDSDVEDIETVSQPCTAHVSCGKHGELSEYDSDFSFDITAKHEDA